MSKTFAVRFAVFATLSFSAGAFSAKPNNILQRNGSVLTKSTRGTFGSHSNNVFRPLSDTHEVNSRQKSMELSLSIRGGSVLAQAGSNPTSLFNTNLIILALMTTFIKITDRLTSKSSDDDNATPKPAAIKSLQIRFLSVFWLLRCADWLQGPYFYEVYSSKILNGVPASLATVSKLFLTGFASTALFGPLVGRASDSKGRKRGTLAFALLYSLGAASTKSNVLGVLLLGRVMSGIGTSLLFSAPEAWLVGEATGKEIGEEGGKYLGETFGMAYAGDALVAILAGQFASAAHGARGSTGPFELSIGFLAAGGVLASLLWKENKAESSVASDGEKSEPTIRDAIKVVKDDPNIMLVGAVQSLFEAAMYIFVLQWPPAITGIIADAFGGMSTPYGTVFSCFMASCLLGSTIFGQLVKRNVSTESSTAAMLSVATVAMSIAAWISKADSVIAMPLASLVAAFFAFEGCVGMYFPSIGTLRSKYVPDSHRSVIMNLFGIPLNVLVVTVFLSIKKLGVSGALGVSAGALGLATASMFKLRSRVKTAAA